MHVHTLVWFLALLLALFSLYRRLLAPGVAILALALYAWDDARGGVLSWVANRSALIAGLFGICVLIAHDKWRRDGWRPGAWLAPLLLALGLLSGEMAIATTAFLFGHALFLDQGPLVRRMARLAPYLLVVIVWQAVCTAGGYGVEASGSYVHPLHEPLAYAAKLLERAPILSLGQLTPIAADFWVFYPPGVKVAVFLLAVALLVIVARIAWPRLAADRQAGFWLVGAGLSLLPISAAGPGDRNLIFVGSAWQPRSPSCSQVWWTTRRRRGGRASSSVRWPCSTWRWRPSCCPSSAWRASTWTTCARRPTRASLEMLRSRGRPWSSYRPRPRRASSSPGHTVTLEKFRNRAGRDFWPPASAACRSPGLTAVTLRVRPDHGFLATEAQRMLRSPSRPFRAGDAVELSNMTATVIETTADGRPGAVDFRFAAPLESPEWLWMRGDGFRLVKWLPPAVGETVVVPAPL